MRRPNRRKRRPNALTALLLEACAVVAAAAQPDRDRPDDTDSEDFRPVGQRTTTAAVHCVSTLVSAIASEIREKNPYAEYFTIG